MDKILGVKGQFHNCIQVSSEGLYYISKFVDCTENQKQIRCKRRERILAIYRQKQYRLQYRLRPLPKRETHTHSKCMRSKYRHLYEVGSPLPL